MRARLTESQLRALWESDRPRGIVEYWDTRVPGLVLRSQQTRMTWAIRYRLDGKQRRHKLGRYPHVGLKEARARAVQAQRLVDEGIDPAVEAAKAVTFAEVAEHYLETHARPRKKTAAEDERKLELYVLPQWGYRRADSITRASAFRRHGQSHSLTLFPYSSTFLPHVRHLTIIRTPAAGRPSAISRRLV